LALVCGTHPQRIGDLLRTVYRLIAGGELPVPEHTCYPLADAATAIRVMSAAEHIGIAHDRPRDALVRVQAGYEHHDAMALLYRHLSEPLPRQETMQLCGKRVIAQPHLVMGDMLPNRNAADDDVVMAVSWLELMARLGFLRKNDNWCKLFDRFLDDRDAEGVWHPHKGLSSARSTSAFVWPMYPLEDHMAGDERWTDVTFRLGLIARLMGRTIDPV